MLTGWGHPSDWLSFTMVQLQRQTRLFTKFFADDSWKRLYGKADNFWHLSFYPSRRLSHDPALKPNNTNRNINIKPKLKANAYNYVSP